MEIFFKDAGSLTQEEISLWEKEYDIDRINSVNCKRDDDRVLSICGDILVLNAFKTRFPNKIFRINRTANGKPFFNNDDFCFSVSHKGTKAVCVVDNYPIGIDIETIKPFNQRLAERVCSQNELEYIGDDSERFAEVWTIKEAYSKLKGSGISGRLQSIIIDVCQKEVCGLPFHTEKIDGYVYSWVVLYKNNE